MTLPSRLSPNDIASLLAEVDAETASAQEQLRYAQPIVEAAGLTVDGSILEGSFFAPDPLATRGAKAAAQSAASISASGDVNTNATLTESDQAAAALHARQAFNPLRGTLLAYPLVLSTTGGHSNTDHIVQQNPDGTVNRLSEFKRNMRRRARQSKSEERGTDRWDLPRIPGARRRRIKRDSDAHSAPPKPPDAGYILYVSQMTTKLRHDNPDRHHNQISAIRRISALWHKLTDDEKGHYNQLARDAIAEYNLRLREYRATGGWREFTVIERLRNKNGVEEVTRDRSSGSGGPWVRIPYEKKNALERELETYDQVIFPPRPKDMEEEYERRKKEQNERRRVKKWKDSTRNSA